ncbi:hypothetical protein I0C86_41620 [Plantactinospora sp. S1510]|uniref:Uncharacterized protein n=2 Tax=Plantactinospora alkalitolerans TaxID=2789879 RepID=A0ABS0HAX0_9ACTN|nr:hypothetical protein [Plantactinospora alkalitolerans]
MAVVYCQVFDVSSTTAEPEHVGVFLSHPAGPPAVGALVHVEPTRRSQWTTSTWRVVEHYWSIDRPDESATKFCLLVTPAEDPFATNKEAH